MEETQSEFEQRIYDQYFDSLVRIAEARMSIGQRRTADGEDIALSALGSFLRRYGKESRLRLEDGESLWPIIATIARRKALNHVRKHRQLKRGEGNVRGDSVFAGHQDEGGGFHLVAGSGSSPDVVAESNEMVQTLLASLPEDQAQIAEQKLAGCTNAEIAKQLDCSVATIERRLKMIRSQWERTQPNSNQPN